MIQNSQASNYKSSIWPNLFIVGAARAGTTSLYRYLQHHPAVYMSPMKEPMFFASLTGSPRDNGLTEMITDEREYLALFSKAQEQHKWLGDASTAYLWSDTAAARIYDRRPDAKIIISLRDPVERAHSHYLMNLRDGWQNCSFLEAISDELAGKPIPFGQKYVSLGYYHDQVARYINTFGEEDVLVILFEDLVTERQQLLERIYRFLELDFESQTPDEAAVFNAFQLPKSRSMTRLIRSRPLTAATKMYRGLMPVAFRKTLRKKFLLSDGQKPPLDETCRQILIEVFTPEMNAVEELLGKELPALRKTWV